MRVYIDGENARNRLAEILVSEGEAANERAVTTYKLRKLLEDVTETESIEINYYASEIKLPHGYTPSADIISLVNIIRTFSRYWVADLKNQGINYIKAGNLKVKQSKKCRNCHQTQDVLQEKGVDVRISVDMLHDALNNNADAIAIFSSDTDLCPSLNLIKSKGKKVIYICFATSVNRAIVSIADETITIPTKKVVEYQ